MGFYQPPQFGSNRPKFTGLEFAVGFNIDNLLAYWKYEASSSPVLDAFTGGHDMAVTGGTFDQTGIIGNSVFFDGIDDFGKVPNSVDFDAMTSELTLTTWLYPANFFTNDYFLVKYTSTSDSSWGCALTNEGGGTFRLKYFLTIGNALNIRTVALVPVTNVWQMYTLTYESGHARLYHNGIELDDDTTITGDVDTSTTEITIAQLGNTSNRYNGRIDEMSLWSRVLNAGEVLELYNGGAGLALPV